MNFIQYMMPNGRKSETAIQRPPEIETLASQIEAKGYVFEIEMLSDYETISMECVNIHDEEDVIASEIVKNGPEVPTATDKLVQEAATSLQLA